MMNADTGRRMLRREHIRQSIACILFTPLGSRVMRRDFGSELMRLIDQPMNDYTIMRCRAATVTAIHRWEDRVRVRTVDFIRTDNGVVVDLLTEERDGTPLALSLPVPMGGTA